MAALTLDAIVRHPIETLAGERLTEAVLGALGVPGDRIVHVRGPEGIRTSRKHHRLLGLQGSLDRDGRPLVSGLPWHATGALELVRGAAGPDAWLEAFEGPERFDVLPLLVATDGAVAAFGRDPRRLRPNLVIGGVDGLDEFTWPGAELHIGAATIAIDSRLAVPNDHRGPRHLGARS